jgi:hypothetical protein
MAALMNPRAPQAVDEPPVQRHPGLKQDEQRERELDV